MGKNVDWNAYFRKTSKGNYIIITQNDMAKIDNCYPDGLFDGEINIYADDAIEKLWFYLNKKNQEGNLLDYKEIYNRNEIPCEDIQDDIADSIRVF